MAKMISTPKANFTTGEAANYLGIGKCDMDKARITGDLSGVKPPPYVRIGKRARYRLVDLEKWLSDQQSFTSVAEETSSKGA